MFGSAVVQSNVRQYATVILAVEDDDVEERVQSCFVGQHAGKATVVDDPAELLSQPVPRDAVVVMSLDVIRELSASDSEALAAFCDRAHILMLLRSEQFLESTPFLELVDGVAFEDVSLDLLPEATLLAGAGYSMLPNRAVADIFTDRVRCDAVSGLAAVELAILEQMRQGEGNREIARCLAMREASVKTKVRAILRGLKLKNRTEAAVFATRQKGLIRAAMRHRLGEVGRLSMEEDEPMPLAS